MQMKQPPKMIIESYLSLVFSDSKRFHDSHYIIEE